jgi:hypothetical protein
MSTRNLNWAWWLAALTTVSLGAGCGGDDTAIDTGAAGTAGSAGKGGSGGTGGSGGSKDAATERGDSSAADASDAGPDATGGSGGAAGASGAGGTGGEPIIDVFVPKPDGSQGVSYNFDASGNVLGWHYAPYGSTTITPPPPPNTPPNDPGNLSVRASAVGPIGWTADDAENRVDASGSLKSLVPFVTNNERMDMQAFSSPTALYDWTGYVVTAKVKLVSSGVSSVCPAFTAWLYVSSAPTYATSLSVPVALVPDTWVTLTYDMATAAVDVTQISQMGVQLSNGPCDFEAGVPVPDAGSTTEAGATDGGTADAGAADAGTTEAATDGGATEAGATDAGTTEASATDGGTTDAAAPGPVIPPTVILIDSVVVSVAP